MTILGYTTYNWFVFRALQQITLCWYLGPKSTIITALLLLL